MATPEPSSPQPPVDLAIARDEVMVQALQTFGKLSLEGKSPTEKAEALSGLIDAAASSKAGISADDKAKIATAWENLLKEKPDAMLAFAESPEAKKIAASKGTEATKALEEAVPKALGKDEKLSAMLDAKTSKDGKELADKKAALEKLAPVATPQTAQAEPKQAAPQEQATPKAAAAPKKKQNFAENMLQGFMDEHPFLGTLLMLFTKPEQFMSDLASGVSNMFGNGDRQPDGHETSPQGKSALPMGKINAQQLARLDDHAVTPVKTQEKDGKEAATLFVNKRGEVEAISVGDNPKREIAPVQLRKDGNDYVIGDGRGISQSLTVALDQEREKHQQNTPEARQKTMDLARGAAVPTKAAAGVVDPFADPAATTIQSNGTKPPAMVVSR